ncbi:MAG: hypothetical protein AMJ95_03365 [Omnitrophica WOR_2 bacterium SM23_72]|nr:MAG: hypothetical protein AMJ95_03365 [Omnitrophica WOR_2 bacterium SM23_72]
MTIVKSIRIEKNRLQALEQIHDATKIPVPELIKQGIDVVIGTYSIYIPDPKFRKELGIILAEDQDILKDLADEK